MPIVDGKYVAPTWVNNASPAIEADELNDLCQTVENLDSASVGAELWVFAGNGVSVTAQGGEYNQTVEAGENGFAVFTAIVYGVYTISANIGGQVSETITVTSISRIYLSLVALDSIPWETINQISAIGAAEQMFSVGDKKSFTLGGKAYQAQIVGFYQDQLVGGGTAGITFQMENCLDAVYQMNSSDTNGGGWSSCQMRTSTMPGLLSQMPSDLRVVIKTVSKRTSIGNQSTSVTTTQDKLWLMSEIEVFGSTAYSVPGEGTRYEFYAAGNSTIKTRSGSASGWWLRSPSRSNSASFCVVYSSGDANSYNASHSTGVAVCFCI